MYNFNSITTGGGYKFRVNGSWTVNWGSTAFPNIGSLSGNNIAYNSGTYMVLFDDLDGSYSFVKL